MNALVRLAAPDDLEAVIQLLVDVYVGEGYTASDRVARLVETVRSARQLLVACWPEGRLAGSVILVEPGGGLARDAHEDEAEIRLLAVDPAARGHGAGSALICSCLELAAAQGARRTVLTTQARMLAAHRLYERHGFRREVARDRVTEHGVRMLAYVHDGAGLVTSASRR